MKNDYTDITQKRQFKVFMLKLLGYKQMPVVDLSITFAKVFEDGSIKKDRLGLMMFARADHVHNISST